MTLLFQELKLVFPNAQQMNRGGQVGAFFCLAFIIYCEGNFFPTFLTINESLTSSKALPFSI